MHKLILLSATYRQASHATSPAWTNAQRNTATASLRRAREIDPDNRLLAGQRRRRLDGEEIRDALLHAAGWLNFRAGGPGFIPPLPEEIHRTVRPHHWKVDADESEHRRRSSYLFVRRNLRYPFFDVFDRPDSNFSCAQRMRTTIAPQSLALLNSKLSIEAAQRLAGRVLADVNARIDPALQVSRAYRFALARSPQPDETQIALEFIDGQMTLLATDARDDKPLALPEPLPAEVTPNAGTALTAFCLSLVNLNEFVYVD